MELTAGIINLAGQTSAVPVFFGISQAPAGNSLSFPSLEVQAPPAVTGASPMADHIPLGHPGAGALVSARVRQAPIPACQLPVDPARTLPACGRPIRSGSGEDDNLADLLIGFHVAMRFDDVIKCEGARDDGLQITRRKTVVDELFRLRHALGDAGYLE